MLLHFTLNLDFILIFSARRRLSKSLSPDRDVESQDKPVINIINATESTNNDNSFSNYPVGKPLEV